MAVPPCVARSRLAFHGLRGRFFVYANIIHQMYLVVNREIQIYLVSFCMGSLIFTVFYMRT